LGQIVRLVELIREGQVGRLIDLFQVLWPALSREVSKYPPAHREDMKQVAMIAVWRSSMVVDLSRGSSVRSYLVRSAINAIRSYARTVKSPKMISIDVVGQIADERCDVESGLVSGYLAEAVSYVRRYGSTKGLYGYLASRFRITRSEARVRLYEEVEGGTANSVYRRTMSLLRASRSRVQKENAEG